MNFIQIKKFCIEWGFDVEDDEHNAMPYSLFARMMKVAQDDHGGKFARFMKIVTDTTDGFTYVCADSWKELEELWENFS